MPFFRTLAEMIQPAHTAVMVVDVQNDYCHPEGDFARRGYPVNRTVPVIERLGRFLTAARAAGATVAFVQTTHAPETVSGPQHFLRHRSGRDPQYLQPGSWGAEFVPPVLPAPGDPVFTKHRYSVFADPTVAERLRGLGIATLVFTGFATNVCVESSLRDAFMRDFYVVLVEDCTGAYADAAHAASVQNIEKHFGPVVSAEQALAVWRG